MNKETGKTAKGIGTLLLTHFLSNKGRLITINELEKEFPQYDRRTIMGNMNNLMASTIGARIVKDQSGVWHLGDGDASRGPSLTLDILKDTENGFIGLGTDGDIYRVMRLG